MIVQGQALQLGLADGRLSSNYKPSCACPRTDVSNNVWKLMRPRTFGACLWLSSWAFIGCVEEVNILNVDQNAAPLAVPISVYGALNLDLQQPYELANVIQSFHV